MENNELLDTMLLRETHNSVTLKNDREVACIRGNWTVNAILAEYRIVLEGRFVVSVHWPGGGGLLSRKDWDRPLPQEATIRIIALPRGGGNSNPLQIIATIAIMVAAYYTGGLAAAAWGSVAGSVVSAAVMVGGSLLLNTLFGQNAVSINNDTSTAKDIYSLNDGGNYLRIGQPFAERFGRQKIYPDLVQYSYTRYEDNEQYLYFYGIVGVGEYDIEGVYIEETLMSYYAEAEYNILPPGTTLLSDGRYYESIPQIVTNVVWPCLEISGQELDVEGVTAIVSGRGTSALYIEYDLQFGTLVGFNDDGSKRSVSVTVVAEVRLIDDDGVATSGWVELYRKTYTAASIDALRYSHKVPAPLGPGRYQIKIYRTTAPSEDTKVQDAVLIMGVKAYGGLHPYYGNVTCIEARIRATDKLSGDVVNKINVVATRKLFPVTDAGFGPTKAASRSIIDAMAYMVTCQNGGRMGDDFLKWDVLSALKDQVDTAEHWFNWSFTSQGSVMDACKKAATCSRMVPYLPGGQFCAVRDDYQELPAVTYTEDDFDEGSFKISHTLPDQSSPTCVQINFVNEVTWNDDSVVYYDERGSEDRPYEVTLEGCQSRDQAYQYAAYLYLDMMNNRSNIEFSTGLKGHIPALFRKVAICASNIDWGQSGLIVAVDDGNGLIWCSEPLDFNGETSGKLYITQKDMANGGPYTVTPTENPYCVNGAIIGLKTMQDDDLAAAKYLFGPYSQEFLHIRLMGIRPQGRNKIQMLGTIIDDSTYDLPGETPGSGSTIPDIGLLVAVDVNYIGDALYAVSWVGSGAAFKVEVDIGSGYTTINDDLVAFVTDFTTSAHAMTVKVTPYDNEHTLQTESAIEVEHSIPAAPMSLNVQVTSEGITASWDPVSGAVGYMVSLVSEGESIYTTEISSVTISVLNSELASITGISPDMEVSVAAVNAAGDYGDAASDEVPISPLSAPLTPVLESTLSSAVIISWGAVTGASGYKVYMGDSAGFDPETGGALKYSGSDIVATVAIDLTPPYAYYFKVAATDVFYSDVGDLVFSSSLSVTNNA